MSTRRQEKIKRKSLEKEKIQQKIHMRGLGQAVKDDGRWFRKPDKFTPTRREKKKLDKIKKIIEE